jgi:hypothetical protein
VLATDGIWDVLTNGDVAAIAMSLLSKAGATIPAAMSSSDPSSIAQMIAVALVRYALQRGSADNITALVVDLSNREAGKAAKADVMAPVARRASASSVGRITPHASAAAEQKSPARSSRQVLQEQTLGTDARQLTGSVSANKSTPFVERPDFPVALRTADASQMPLSSEPGCEVNATTDPEGTRASHCNGGTIAIPRTSSDSATVAGTFSPHPLHRAQAVDDSATPSSSLRRRGVGAQPTPGRVAAAADDDADCSPGVVRGIA